MSHMSVMINDLLSELEGIGSPTDSQIRKPASPQLPSSVPQPVFYPSVSGIVRDPPQTLRGDDTLLGETVVVTPSWEEQLRALDAGIGEATSFIEGLKSFAAGTALKERKLVPTS